LGDYVRELPALAGEAMVRLLREFGADRRGLSLIEYGLIAALIATTLVTALSNMGTTLKTFYTTISTTLASA
jgi:pilus assembly protein Flp/PilA